MSKEATFGDPDSATFRIVRGRGGKPGRLIVDPEFADYGDDDRLMLWVENWSTGVSVWRTKRGDEMRNPLCHPELWDQGWVAV
jgi:hypothetical protein